MKAIFCFCLPALGAFLIQYFLGCRTRNKVLRYIPLYFFAVSVLFAFLALRSDPGFFIGGNVVAALVWCMIGISFLLGHAFAVFLYKAKAS